MEDGTTKGGLIQLRQSLTLSKNEEVHLHDATSSKYQVIADLQQIRQVMTLIHGNYKDALVDDVLLNWHAFSEQEKLDHFNENICHEMNFFLARKDEKFFKDHVVNYIANKIEWTFFDIYLLARFADGFTQCQQELSHILTSTAKFKELLILEKSVAIEFGTWQGDIQIKERAKRLARNLVDKIQVTIDDEYTESH